MPRSIGVRQLPSPRCGCERCRKAYPAPERRPTKNCTGNWQARWYRADGSRDSATREKKQDAIDARTAALAAIAAGTYRDPKRGMIPLSTWYDIWLNGRRVADATTSRNASNWRKHIKPRWGAIPLRAITYQDVQNWVVSLEDAGLAPVTVRSILTTLGLLTRAAKKDQRIDVNPCTEITIGSERGRSRVTEKAPTIEQIQALAAAIRPVGPKGAPRNIYGRIPLLILETGLRWGELTGLLPDCVHLERGSLIVCRILENVDGRKQLRDYPKTEAGERVIPLTRAARQLLREHLEVQPAVDGKPIFRTAHDRVIDRSDFRKSVWLPAAIRAGVHSERELPSGVVDHWPTVHSIRHTFASRLENAGVPESIRKEVLGHERPRSDVTWRYTHAPDDYRDLVLAALGDAPEQPLKSMARPLRLIPVIPNSSPSELGTGAHE